MPPVPPAWPHQERWDAYHAPPRGPAAPLPSLFPPPQAKGLQAEYARATSAAAAGGGDSGGGGDEAARLRANVDSLLREKGELQAAAEAAAAAKKSAEAKVDAITAQSKVGGRRRGGATRRGGASRGGASRGGAGKGPLLTLAAGLGARPPVADPV
jgi:hypothetical protein